MTTDLWKALVSEAFDAFPGVHLDSPHRSSYSDDMEHGASIVRSSLEDPHQTLPLSALLRSASERVTLVVPDAYGDVGEEVLTAVLAHVDAFMPRTAELTVLVANGWRQPPRGELLARSPHLTLLARHGITPRFHDTNDCVRLDLLGVREPEQRAWVNRAIVETDLVIVLGRVELRFDHGVQNAATILVGGTAGRVTATVMERLAISSRYRGPVDSALTNAYTTFAQEVVDACPTVFGVLEATGTFSKAYISGHPTSSAQLLADRPDAHMNSPSEMFHAAALFVESGAGASLDTALDDFFLLALQRARPLFAGAPCLLVFDGTEGLGDASMRDAFQEAIRRAFLPHHGHAPPHFAAGDPSSVYARRRGRLVHTATHRTPLHILTSRPLGVSLPDDIHVHSSAEAAIQSLHMHATAATNAPDPKLLLCRTARVSLPTRVCAMTPSDATKL